MVDDTIFWDRLGGMPAWEAEQECVRRREHVSHQNAQLLAERAKLVDVYTRDARKKHDALGASMAENNAQLAKINEHIKYLRKLQNQVHWREAVRQLFGDEGVEQCIVYIQQRWPDVYATRSPG